jgi:neuropeptide Y receptor
VASLTALPTLLVSELTLPESEWHINGGYYICQEMWQDRDAQTQYTTSLLLLQFCLPLSVMIFTYGRIGVEIWGKKTPGEAHQNRDLRLARSKRKVLMYFVVVV